MGGKTAVEQRYAGTIRVKYRAVTIKEVYGMMECQIIGLAKDLFAGPEAVANVRRGFYAYEA